MNKSVIAAVVVGLLSVTMLAGWRSYGGPMDPAKVSRIVGARVDNALDDVDATDTQRTQIKAISERLVKDGFELRKSKAETKKAVLAQWESSAPDKSKLYALVDARLADFKAFAYKVVDAGVEVHGILNAKQRGILTEKIKERMNDDE